MFFYYWRQLLNLLVTQMTQSFLPDGQIQNNTLVSFHLIGIQYSNHSLLHHRNTRIDIKLQPSILLSFMYTPHTVFDWRRFKRDVATQRNEAKVVTYLAEKYIEFLRKLWFKILQQKRHRSRHFKNRGESKVQLGLYIIRKKSCSNDELKAC